MCKSCRKQFLSYSSSGFGIPVRAGYLMPLGSVCDLLGFAGPTYCRFEPRGLSPIDLPRASEKCAKALEVLHTLCTTFPQPAILRRCRANTFFSQHCSGKSLPGRDPSQGRRAEAEENSIHFVLFLSGRLNR